MVTFFLVLECLNEIWANFDFFFFAPTAPNSYVSTTVLCTKLIVFAKHAAFSGFIIIIIIIITLLLLYTLPLPRQYSILL